MSAGTVVEDANAGGGTAILLALFNRQVLVSKGGDLRQVGDAENLLGAGEGFELLADGLSGAATDADVDFVKDESARRGFFL